MWCQPDSTVIVVGNLFVCRKLPQPISLSQTINIIKTLRLLRQAMWGGNAPNVAVTYDVTIGAIIFSKYLNNSERNAANFSSKKYDHLDAITNTCRTSGLDTHFSDNSNNYAVDFAYTVGFAVASGAAGQKLRALSAASCKRCEMFGWKHAKRLLQLTITITIITTWWQQHGLHHLSPAWWILSQHPDVPSSLPCGTIPLYRTTS